MYTEAYLKSHSFPPCGVGYVDINVAALSLKQYSVMIVVDFFKFIQVCAHNYVMHQSGK